MSLISPRVDGQRFEDRLQVADAHALAEQVLKTRCSSPARSRPGTTSSTRAGVVAARAVEQPPDLFAGHQLVGVAEHDLAEMAGDDRRRFEDPAAGQLGDLAAVGVDPDGRLAGHRVDAVAAVGARDQSGRRARPASRPA